MSHVPSQPAVVPSPRSMLSRDRSMPLDTWNLSGTQGNVFGNPRSTFGSSQTPYKGILHFTNQSATGAIPVQGSTGRPVARGEERIGVPMSAGRPSTMNSSGNSTEFYGCTAETADIGASVRFPILSTFPCWKIRCKIQMSSCSDFLSEDMSSIKEVEMADSVDEFKSSRSIEGEDFPNFEMLDARIASALNNIIQNSNFKKKVSLETVSPKRGWISSWMTYRFHELRLLSSHWCS